jgi:hypothetical protein
MRREAGAFVRMRDDGKPESAHLALTSEPTYQRPKYFVTASVRLWTWSFV